MIPRLFLLSILLCSVPLAGCFAGASADTGTPDADAAEAVAPDAADAADTDAAPTAADAPAKQEVATFTVPELTGELGKRLVASLGEQPGVVSAKVDEAEGRFRVTFEPGATDPAALLTRLQTVSPAAALEGVAAADGSAPKAGCGGCPSKTRCPKAQASAG